MASCLPTKFRSDCFTVSSSKRASIPNRFVTLSLQPIQDDDADIHITNGVVANRDDINMGIRYSTEADKIAVNTTRARYLDVHVGNFGAAVEFYHTKAVAPGCNPLLLQRAAALYRDLVEYLYNTGSIISATDFELTVFAENPQRLLKSSHSMRYDFTLDKSQEV